MNYANGSYETGADGHPAAIRKRHQIGGGARLVWLDDGETIRIVPTPADPIASLRGRGERLTERLLKERRADRKREEKG